MFAGGAGRACKASRKGMCRVCAGCVPGDVPDVCGVCAGGVPAERARHRAGCVPGVCRACAGEHGSGVCRACAGWCAGSVGCAMQGI